MMKECDIGWIWSKVWVQGGRAMKQMKSFQKQRGPADMYKVGGIPWGVTSNWNLIFLKTLRYPGWVSNMVECPMEGVCSGEKIFHPGYQAKEGNVEVVEGA